MRSEIFIGSQDDFDYEDYLSELNDRCIADRETEELSKVNFKKGKHTHRYNEGLLNSDILQLHRKGLSYREIANKLDCPKSTICYRIKMLREKNLLG